MSMSTLSNLGQVGFLDKLQMSGVMPFTEFLKLMLLFFRAGIQVVHSRPGSTGWREKQLIRAFSFQSLQVIEVPASRVAEDFHLSTKSSCY